MNTLGSWQYKNYLIYQINGSNISYVYGNYTLFYWYK